MAEISTGDCLLVRSCYRDVWMSSVQKVSPVKGKFFAQCFCEVFEISW